MKIRPVEENVNNVQASPMSLEDGAAGNAGSGQGEAYIVSCVGIGYSNIAKKT
jgi:hypothetical protein